MAALPVRKRMRTPPTASRARRRTGWSSSTARPSSASAPRAAGRPAEAPAGLIELVPTYRSLMAHYDPLTLPRADLIARVERLVATLTTEARPRARWVLPVCYDGDCGEDVAAIAVDD